MSDSGNTTEDGGRNKAISVRVPITDLDEIDRIYIRTRRYRDISDFIRYLIKKELMPGQYEAEEESRIFRLLENPAVQERLVKIWQERTAHDQHTGSDQTQPETGRLIS